MMAVESIIIFGYSEFAKEIARQIRNLYDRIVIYSLKNTEVLAAKEDGFDAHLADLEDQWDDLLSFDLATTRIICALENEAENVFLTLSLRDSFGEEPVIIALASTQENTAKLRLAGANKVISELQMTSNLIIERLEKPLITRLFDEMMDVNRELKIAQITLEEESCAVGQRIDALLNSITSGVIVLAVVDREMSESFIFTAKGHDHMLDPGDVLVVIGYDEQIRGFEQAIRGCT